MTRRLNLTLPVQQATADTQTRELHGLAVPWGAIATRFGVQLRFVKDGLTLPEQLDTVKLLVGHDPDRPVGYATNAVKADDGLRMTFAVPPTARGTAILEDVDALLRDGLSVGVELDEATEQEIDRRFWESDDGDPIDVGGTLRETSLTALPQFNGARVGAATGQLITLTAATEEAPTMPDVETPTAVPLRELAAQLAPLIHAAAPAHPLARYSGLDEYMHCRFTEPDANPRVALALIDQITTNNPGLVPPGWLTTIVGIIDAGRPLITALGGPRALPDSGMEVDWPYYDGNLLALVDVQATEKTQVTSVRVDIKKGTSPIATYAGASDVSYQLIRRSSPPYREAYERILAAAFAARTEQAAEAALIAAGTGTGTWDPAAGTADQLRAALFAASSTVADVTGRPADVAGAAPDVYAKIGGLPDLWPAAYGTNNTAGTAQASTLDVNVSGLRIVRLPYAAAGTLVVTNSEAFAWHEDGPFPVAGEDVARLGVNVGIWGMGAGVAALPAGIVKIDDGIPLGE